MPIDTLATEADLAGQSYTKRTPGFERLGYVVDPDMSIETAMQKAHLDNWNVRTEPLTAMTTDGVFTLEKHQIIMRTFDGTPAPIAPIGKQYTPVQNEELAAFAATILDESELRVAACGAIDGGARVFFILEGEERTYGGIDKVCSRLFVATGHDGTMSTIVKPFWTRLFCVNQIGGLFATKHNGASGLTYSVRHTSTIEGKVQQAREALGLRVDLQDELDAEIERLLSVKVSDQDFEKVVDAVAPLTDDLKPGGRTRRERVRDDLWNLWNADTQKPIANTAWAAVNAVGEYVDWFGPGADDQDKRARAHVLGSREAKKAELVHKTLEAVA